MVLRVHCIFFWLWLCAGWWKWTHNTHHNSCNSINDDPDVQYIPVFALSVRASGAPEPIACCTFTTHVPVCLRRPCFRFTTCSVGY